MKLQTINEFINKQKLDSIEDQLDELFKTLNIDIEFTKHFYDRLNDKRNGKDITPEEVINTFNRLYDKHAPGLSKFHKDTEAVIIDLNNKLNVPFKLSYDKKKDAYELASKTIMRTNDFKTGNQRRLKV